MSVKKPTGVQITRKNNTFKAVWKKGENYSTMQYGWEWHINVTGEGSVGWLIKEDKYHTTNSTHTSKTISGRKIVEVIFYVRGKKSGKWSDWATKSYHIHAPLKPSMSTSLVSTNETKFTWTAVADNADRPMDKAVLQKVLVENCPKDVESLVEWKNATNIDKAISGNTSIEESSGQLAGKSFTRVVRVKEVGLGGDSNWRYAKHVYAAPYPAQNVRGTVTKTEESTNCLMYWSTPSNAAHPIDEVVPQYTIAVPAEGMECPEGAQATQLPAMSDVSGTEGKQFTIGTPIGADSAVFLSVLTKHDSEETESAWVLAGGDALGALKSPTFDSAPTFPSTTSVTIEASNESEVEDSFLVDFLEREDGTVEVLGLHDAATKTYTGLANITNARVGLKAYVGTWNSTLKQVEEPPVMQSAMVWSSGNVPVAPSTTDFKLSQSTVPNTVLVTWDYAWGDADSCEVSWSTEPDAWISTEDPDYYIVLKGTQDKLAIKGVEAGTPLYVRTRYIKGFDDDAIYSPYSDTKSITISTVPAVPKLTLEKEFYAKGEDVVCSWVYVTADGTEQAQAIIAERSGTSAPYTYTELKSVFTEQKTVIPNNWYTGTQHALVVNVANSSGNWSGWSEPTWVTIATPVTCTITQASLVSESEGYELQELPLTVTVTGAGTGGQTTLMILRKGDYRLERPDGNDFTGHDKEVIYQNFYSGEAQQTINLTDIIDGCHLDDSADYTLYASIEDEYGQTANDSIDFTVNWQNKAVMPVASVTVGSVAEIVLGTPTGAHTGDYVDIYRRSVDGNELIVKNAEFGTTYVDPYPAIGNFGYLIVGMNAYGDYIMSTDEFAWLYVGADFESDTALIDFNGEQIAPYYNVDFTHSWSKDFQKTKYLGGSVVGDYVGGVERSGSVNFVSVPIVETAMLEAMRRLAAYTGNCHVRTKEGSSFTASIEVTENDTHDTRGYTRNFSLNIEKVDNYELDGMTLAEWEAQ